MNSKGTWRVEVLSAVDSKSKSTDVNPQITKVTCRIENFSSFRDKERLSTEISIVDGTKWRIIIDPKPCILDSLSIYLEVADSINLPCLWSGYAQFGVAVIDQINRKSSSTTVSTRVYQSDAMNSCFGFPSLDLSEFLDTKRGYLINDTCLVEVYVSTNGTENLISHDFMLQSDHGPSEEDMNTFFNSLEAELFNSSIVFSQEDAKDALAKVDESLKMTPINIYNPGTFYTLKHAFNILARFNGSAIPITIEQKDALLAMEERLEELADRAAKAVKDKHHLTEYQSTKLTITCNLDSKLLRYKEVDSEVKQLEQKLAALLAERNEIFRSSKEIKMELEALRNKCPEYESKAKVVEEEEKTVEAELARMKDFISSIKEKI